jgi:copper chaperone CopZ
MQKLTLKVEGMMCPMCESHVNDAVRCTYPKCKVTSSHKLGQTVVIGEGLDPTRVKELIEKDGYRVLETCEEPYEKKHFLSKLFGKK